MMQTAFHYDSTPRFVHSAYQFTGKERDAESGLDYFGARYYGSNMGRFMSPDWADVPAPVPYAKLDDPQSLNLYAYVGNHPTSAIDATGHDPDFSNFDPDAASFFRKSYARSPAAHGSQAGGNDSGEGSAGEDRYLSIINNDVDPEGIGHDSISWQWSGGSTSRLNRDKQYAALAVGLGAPNFSGASLDTLRDSIQYIYDNLQLFTQGTDYDGSNDQPGLHGGNWNFSTTIGALSISGLGFNTQGPGRNGLIPSVHFEGASFHVDTANGLSIAGPIHWIWDVGLGQTIFRKDGIPR
jgi:RHS repeat-associated protein